MVKLVDAQAWGVCGQYVHPGSSPGNGKKKKIKKDFKAVFDSKKNNIFF